jgi:hypothetical protein
MNTSRLIVRSLLAAIATMSLAGALTASAAYAERAWWQLSVDSAPAILQPGQAANEVQEVTVSATGGTFELATQTPTDASHTFTWNATHQEMQEGLEEMFGKGNVEVPSGQGDESGSDPYRVIFKGELEHKSVNRIEVPFSSASGLTGGRREVTVSEAVKGRSDATLILTAANMGNIDATGPVTATAKLPPGLRALSITGKAGFAGFTELECSTTALTCTYSESTLSYEQVQLIIPVEIEPGAKPSETVGLAISGGNAEATSVTRAIKVADTSPAFGVERAEGASEEYGGGEDTQAGSHPFQLTTTLMLNQRVLENPFRSQFRPEPAEMSKDLAFKLPPGLIGNPTPFPQCTTTQFTKADNFVNECPDNTAIGVAAVTISVPGLFPFVTVAVPLFNLTPSVGEPARFGFEAVGVPVYLDTSVRTGGDYGVTVKVANITQAAILVGSRVTFWGVPGDPRHDGARGWSCIADGTWQAFRPEVVPPCAPLAQLHPPPLIELPTSCTGPLQVGLEADSWQHPSTKVTAALTQPLPALDGCNRLPFSPSITTAPDGQAASTPSGLTVGIHVPQDVSLDPEGLGEADVKDTTVALPAGVTLSPAAGDGLQSCSEQQIGLQVHAPAACPEASKVATVEIKTPLLPNRLSGEVYLAAQNANPFGSLVALYLVAEDPVSGTIIKLAGQVKPDPVTGQLVTVFPNTPQLPFEDLALHFFGGSRAPLATPALCGAYATASSITPWSETHPAEPSSIFDITSGPNGSLCFNPLPFGPSLTAGMTNIQAGALSQLTMTMSREDGNQNLQGIVLRTPPGLSGLLSNVKLCGEAQANEGTCGPESLIGETTVSVGLGDTPFSVRGGRVYITGPYKGAPFGLSIVNPAKAGPYDLGKGVCDCVLVRAKIEVDPQTAALTVTTDNTGPYRIPTILEGIPLQIKHVNVTINRPGFTFNPTNCNPMGITGTLTSTEGATSSLSVPFQVTNCAALKFAPKFSVSTSGRTSKVNGASLTTKLAYPNGSLGNQANIGRVKVELPKQLPSRLTTLQQACLAATFNANPAGCPAASIVGHAKVITPLLPVPLEGPAYFVSHGGEAFPDLTIVLQGYGVTVDLVGTTFISRAGITSTTFKSPPDVPFNSFELTLPQGRFSALAANANLCALTKLVTVRKRVTVHRHGRVTHPLESVKQRVAQSLLMPTEFTAQNGAQLRQDTKIAVTGCPKAKTTKSKPSRKKTHRKKKKS